MALEVITYGSAEYVRVAMNAVAAIAGEDDYITLVRLFVLIAFLWGMMLAAIGQRLLDVLGKLVVAVLIFFIVLVPKEDVLIRDRIDPAMGSVVANVPLGVAWAAHLSSRIGDWLTRSYEALFSLPDDLNYSENGYLFGAHLVEASTRFEITDQRTAANLSEFWNQCVFYDVMLGLYGWDDLTWNTDLWTFLQTNTSAVRRFRYVADDGTASLRICRTAASGVLQEDLDNALAEAQAFYGRRIFGRELTPTEAASRFAASMPVAYNYLAELSRTSADLLRQNVLTNALSRGATTFATSADATAAAVDYAVARAETERRNTFQALGELALRFLPLLRNVLEALFYAAFPIVVLLAFLAPRQIIVSYAQVMAWIQLWAPLYAILHFGMMFYGKSQGTAGVVLPGGGEGLTLATSSALGQAMADMGYVANYLTASIPFIAFLIIRGGGIMAASLASQVMSGVQSVAARGAEEATSGNIAFGQLQQDNINWFKNDTNPTLHSGVGSHTDAHGNVHSLTSSGGHAVQALQSRLGVQADMSSVVQHARTHGLAQLEQASHSHGQRYAEGLAASLDTAMDMTRSTGWSSQHTEGWDQADRAAWTRAASHMEEASRSVQEQHGLSKKEADQVVYQAAANLNLGTSAGVGAGFRGSGSVSAGVTGRHTEETAYQDAYQTARSALDRATVSSGVEALEHFARTASSQDSHTGGNELAARLHSGLQETVRAEERWEASLSRATEAREQLQRLETAGQSLRADLSNEFVQDLTATGSLSANQLMAHGNEARLEAAMGTWLGLRLGGMDGVDAAGVAAERGANPTYWDTHNPLRELRGNVDRSVGNGSAAVGDAAGAAELPGDRGSVESASSIHRTEVLQRPASAGDPHAGAASRGLFPENMGQPPLRAQAQDSTFRADVEGRADPELGRAAWEQADAVGQVRATNSAQRTETEATVEQGRSETQGLLGRVGKWFGF